MSDVKQGTFLHLAIIKTLVLARFEFQLISL